MMTTIVGAYSSSSLGTTMSAATVPLPGEQMLWPRILHAAAWHWNLYRQLFGRRLNLGIQRRLGGLWGMIQAGHWQQTLVVAQSVPT